MSNMGRLRGLGNILRGAGHSGFKLMYKWFILFIQTVNKDDVLFTVGTWEWGEKTPNHT